MVHLEKRYVPLIVVCNVVRESFGDIIVNSLTEYDLVLSCLNLLTNFHEPVRDWIIIQPTA